MRGVHVQQLREDYLGFRDDYDLNDRGIGDTAATLLGLMLPALTSLSYLKCATPPVLVSAPLTMFSHHPCSAPHPHSLSENRIGDKGASALAAFLKETRISELKCAAAPSVRLSVSA